MKRSEMRVSRASIIPDPAMLHPDYTGLDPHVCDSAGLGRGNLCEQCRDERLKIRQTIERRLQNEGRDRECGKILLKGEIPVYREEDIKLFRSKSEQLSIFDGRPTHLAGRLGFVSRKLRARRQSMHSSRKIFTKLPRPDGPSPAREN